ncbi:MFS transporter [Nonomuraea angiospora]|uniref:MFS transporter n=1 Tax=Nonomuraea angiospora TaxID=46172 RepID=UPI0029A6F8F3|nr:MFS transporter [Nonomuraea angiospora]MDX3103898.1 MFS transporter [Nonomuraea angiospora]
MDASASTASVQPGAAQAANVPHRWRNLAVLSGVSVVDNTEAGLINTVFPTLAAALRLDSGHLGVIAALGKIASVPAGPFWVWLSSRIGRRGALVATTVTGGLFGIAAGFSQNFVQLLICCTLMSAAVIGGSPIAMAVIADSFADEHRARANGIFFGTIQLAAIVLGPVMAVFVGLEDGWRWALWTLGGVCVAAGLVVAAFFTDPGIGSSEKQLADLAGEDRTKAKVTVASVAGLFRIPTYTVMMVSRLLSGHLLIAIFGVQFLVTERGIDNATAILVALPFGLGYSVATLSAGFVLPRLDRLMPSRGRVLVLQLAQILFAVIAFFGTQFRYETIATYAVFWALLGACQGLNPPVNRPIVAGVVLPELRGQAYAIWLTVFETIAWALFSLMAGSLAATLGIQGVFLWVLVILMIVNGLLLSVLYVTYPRDTARVARQLELRRSQALAD